MANEDKFAKTIDDEQLDQVAGGTAAELQKDIKFLNAIGKDLGIKLDKNATSEQLENAWGEGGVIAGVSKKKENNNYGEVLISNDDWQGVQFSRQDAMIKAMRKTKKFVDLDQYL